MKHTLQDYKSAIEPIWCPGCGDYGLLKALTEAFQELAIDPEDIISVSGIGCSGRLPHFLNTYSLHGTHGRALPTATGAKVARPDCTVLCVGGDGDGLGIGGGHIAHAARKNVDLTYILVDNRIYGLTKGQASPTTPLGTVTKTSPQGVYEDPVNPIAMFLTYDISFIARATSYQIDELTEILKAAIQHKGMSMVYVISPCRTFPVLDAKQLKKLFAPLPADHPRDNKLLALERAYASDPQLTGVFYQIQRPSLEERLQSEIQTAVTRDNGGTPYSLDKLFAEFS
ncbi:MAG: thiamine pyrophosphate-dependent enzyme [Candidatus Eiseniibacteriota bacterium]|jgi:2-oxoglutarate ferredoxin oxidoreductase subunit beta